MGRALCARPQHTHQPGQRAPTRPVCSRATSRAPPWWGQRQGLVVKTNPWAEPYFSYNQTAFLAEVRIGFNLSDEKRFAMLSAVPTA